MNGPMSMYKLKPLIYFNDPVHLTPTMYKIKSLYSHGTSDSDHKTDLTNGRLPNVLDQVKELISKKSLSEVEDIKNRQEAILHQLTYLKQQMLLLREELNKRNSVAGSSVCKEETTSFGTEDQNLKRATLTECVFEEVVVHASPDHPPYSLLALNRLWPDALRLHLTCHTHSSLVSLPEHVNVFSSVSSTSNVNLNVRLIWKQMGTDCELVISPLTHTPIQGEVNILRYLHRCIDSSNDIVTDTKLDSVLDLCHRLNHARTVRDKQALVRALNVQLGKAEWLLGGRAASVADAAAWSALRSLTGVDITQNMAKWQAQCNAVFAVGAA